MTTVDGVVLTWKDVYLLAGNVEVGWLCQLRHGSYAGYLCTAPRASHLFVDPQLSEARAALERAAIAALKGER